MQANKKAIMSIVTILLLSGCANMSNREIAGTAIGAGAGALVGGAVGNTTGALVGGAAGAAVGYGVTRGR